MVELHDLQRKLLSRMLALNKATSEKSEEEFKRLRVEYLKKNRFSFSWSLMFRVVGTIILVTLAVSGILALSSDFLSNIFGEAIADRISSILSTSSGVGVILWIAQWDDRRRFTAFLATSNEKAEQASTKRPNTH